MAYQKQDSKPKGKSTDIESKLREHAKHHTKKHIDMMRKLIREGKTFSQAHKITTGKVGK